MYGMIEIFLYIVLRWLNGLDVSMLYWFFFLVWFFFLFEYILVIDVLLVCDIILVINDVVEIYFDGSFFILGRKDNIINIGGIKVQVEQIEEIFCFWMRVFFVIIFVFDVRLGEVVVFLVEKGVNVELLEIKMKEFLFKYQLFKMILLVGVIFLMEMGKINCVVCW